MVMENFTQMMKYMLMKKIIFMMKIIIFLEQDPSEIYNYIIKDYQIRNLSHKKKEYIHIGGGI